MLILWGWCGWWGVAWRPNKIAMAPLFIHVHVTLIRLDLTQVDVHNEALISGTFNAVFCYFGSCCNIPCFFCVLLENSYTGMCAITICWYWRFAIAQYIGSTLSIVNTPQCSHQSQCIACCVAHSIDDICSVQVLSRKLEASQLVNSLRLSPSLHVNHNHNAILIFRNDRVSCNWSGTTIWIYANGWAFIIIDHWYRGVFALLFMACLSNFWYVWR